MKPGDVVRLKSGGPRMTVESTRAAKATCVWFEPLDSAAAIRVDEGRWGPVRREEYDELVLSKVG